MARSTRHSRDRKPGVTIDGTATEASKTDAKADAGRPDAAKTDAGKTDAGKTDAGKTDAGKPDAGTGTVDAGKPTAGGAVNTDVTTGPDKGNTSTGATSASAATTAGGAMASSGATKAIGATPASGTADTAAMVDRPGKPSDAKSDAKVGGGKDAGKGGSSASAGGASSASTKDTKPTDPKATDTKSADPKPAGTTPSDTKRTDAKPTTAGGGSKPPSAVPATTGGSGGGRSNGPGDRGADNDNRGRTPIVAGLIGGVAALLLAWLLSALGMFGSDPSEEIAALRAEVQQLRAAETITEDDVRALVVEGAPAVDQAALDQQIAALVDERIATAANEAGGQNPIDTAIITSLDERLARLEANEGALADAGGLTPEIEARLAQIEAGLGSGDGDAAAALAALQNEIASIREGQDAINPAVERRIAQVEAGLGADPEARQALQALEARLEEIAGQQGQQDQTVAQVLAQLEESGVIAGDTFTRVEGLTNEFGNLTAGVEGVRGEVGILSQTVDEQVVQLGTLRDQIETVRGAVDGVDANLASAVQELRTELQTVRGTASNANGAIQSVRGTVQDVSTRLGTVASNLDAVRTDLGNATGRLDDVSGRVDDLSSRIDTVASNTEQNSTQIADLAATVEEARTDRTVARALAANTLKNTIDRGLPFAPELEAYAAVAENPDGLSPLREFSGSGVPTTPQLLDRFDAMAARVKRVDMNVGEDADLGDQLGASMRSLFTVRDVDVISGDSTDAVLARMENALRANDLQRVVSEAQFLGVAEQEVAEPFLEDVRARIAADRLIDDALSSALRQAG